MACFVSMSTFARTASVRITKVPAFSRLGGSCSRSLSFSFAGPRKLNEIVKLDLLKDKSATDVKDIWMSYHESKDNMHGTCLDGKDCRRILERAAECPFFIQPIFRQDGFFMLVSQFQTPCHFLMAYLEDYKMDAARAQPLLTFSVFDDLVGTQNIGLVRVDVINKGIEDDEGLKVVNHMLDAYRKEEEFLNVHAFNKSPDSFDVDDYISCQNQKWKAEGGADDVQ